MSQKIIIRTPNHLGDCIMALPMVNETKEVYPATHLTVLTPEYLADLYIANPSIDEILTIPQNRHQPMLLTYRKRQPRSDEKNAAHKKVTNPISKPCCQQSK